MPRPCCFAAGEHDAGFVDGEGVIVAERVAIARQAGGCNFRDELFGNRADVRGAAIRKFRRDGVRGQQSGNDAGGAFVVEAREHAQHVQFGVAVETVAGLGFECRGAAAQHPVAMAACGGEQFIFSCGAGQLDGAQNAAAGRGDLLIGGAGDALFELVGAIAGEDEMRVRIDEARCHAAPFGVDDCRVGRDFGLEVRRSDRLR